MPIIYHNIIFKLGNIFKKQKEKLKQYNNNYYEYFAEEFLKNKFKKNKIKDYNETEIENKIKKIIPKDIEQKFNSENSSKIWQFNEFLKEPIIINEVSGENFYKEEKGDEKQSHKPKINEDILYNNKIEIENLYTINQIIELFNKSTILIQLFPFLIGKITNEEINKLFNTLYSIYISYKKYDKSILSEDSGKYCKIFEKICLNLIKYEVDLDDFEEIKKLKANHKEEEFQSVNLIDFSRPNILNIPKDLKWFKSKKEKSKYEKIIQEQFKIEKVEEEFVMKQNVKNISFKNETNKNESIELKILSKKDQIIYIKKEEGIEKEKEVEEIFEDLDIESDDDIKYEKETGKIEELSKDKFDKMKYLKDDKKLIKHAIYLMTRDKKQELRKPELIEDNELKQELFNYTILSKNKKNPSDLLMDLSNIISFKLLQASINVNTQVNKICAIIAIDCCRTIDKMKKFFHAILAFGMINCLNAMEIPYSVVIFADYQFLFTIKEFEKQHKDEIYKIILDCIMVPRYSTRISDACIFIDKKVIHPKISNRRIFFISNGLDPKLKSPEQWNSLFLNNKDKYCFYFIKPEIESEKYDNKIYNIWEKFKKITGNEVVIINNFIDIINGEEKIYESFGNILSENINLTKEEKEKFSKNVNNINSKFYQSLYYEKYDLDEKKLMNILGYLKYSYDDHDF